MIEPRRCGCKDTPVNGRLCNGCMHAFFYHGEEGCTHFSESVEAAQQRIIGDKSL